MRDHSAPLMQSEDDMCMYFDAAEDQNIDDSNHHHHHHHHNHPSHEQEAPEGMPQEYYSGLEVFLAQEAPSLELLGPGPAGVREAKQKQKQKRDTVQSNKRATEKQQRQQRQQQKKKNVARSERGFDFDLLQQAMQYTAMLALEDDAEQRQQQQQSRQTQQQVQQSTRSQHGARQKPPIRRNSSSKSLVAAREREAPSKIVPKKQTAQKKPLPRRMREAIAQQQAAQLQREASWSAPSASDTRPIDADNTLDVASLVENFEKGLALEQLRQELAASQTSMNHSHEVLSQAAQEFFRYHGQNAAQSGRRP